MTLKQRKKQLIQKINSDTDRLLYELKSIGVDPYAYRLIDKGISFNIKLYSISCVQANIIKQEAIASGIDTAVAKGSVSCSLESTDALILGSISGIKKLIQRLKKQPFGLSEISKSIELILNQNLMPTFKSKDILFNFKNPLIMGILNITPDSFSDGGKYQTNDKIKIKLDEFDTFNVDIVDIGGESSRPGAKPISTTEEIDRIMPAVEMALAQKMFVSVDTCKSKVAQCVLAAGVHIINDISGIKNSTKIASLCATYNAGLCLMHTKGTPEMMQINPQYDNIICEIYDYFDKSISTALSLGLEKENIIIDPGFGFGKTLQNNYDILKNINEFKTFGLPVLAGVSRKSMIGKVTGEEVQDRIISSKIIETLALHNGANIIRTHDVKEAEVMIKLWKQYSSSHDAN